MGDSDEWVDKAEEERLGILAKYDKGREEGAEIDPWEDPAFEIYHATDHYGFIHDTRLPEKIGGQELKAKDLEVKRSDKWIKMYKAWPKYKHSDKFVKRTYKGIPNKVRGLFWQLMLDLENIKKQQEGKYSEMYSLARLHSPDIRQIDLDVNRTYRDHIMFRERYGVKQRSLFNILAAYSVYNSEVGYCQGMSQVAALLLMYMDEEDAFWGLAQLMTDQKYGMHGFFVAGFPKLVRFQAHHDKVLQVLLPKLKKHLDKQGVDSGLYTLKWFFQCFLDRVPFELALRLWDIFLLDGDQVLICGAYTILKIHFKPLISRKSMDEVLWFLQSIVPAKFGLDCDKAIEVYLTCLGELKRKKLHTAGDPSDDEIPKKPFGVIANIPKPVPVRREAPDEKINKEIEAKRQQRAQLATDETDDFDNEEEEMEETSMMDKASASRISLAATSVASSSIADSPRNVQRPLSSISNISYASAVGENSGTLERPLKMNGVNHVKSKQQDNPSSLISSNKQLSPTSESFDEPPSETARLSAKESFMQSGTSSHFTNSSVNQITSPPPPVATSTPTPPSKDLHQFSTNCNYQTNYKSNERLHSTLNTKPSAMSSIDHHGSNSYTGHQNHHHTSSLGRKPVKPVRVSKSPSPPPPPPRSVNNTSASSTTSTFISHEQTITSTSRYSSSVFEYSSMVIGDTSNRSSSGGGGGLQNQHPHQHDGSIGRKREPPPVSPRKCTTLTSSTSPQSSSGRSYASIDSSISSVSIPHGGEAVRIHVPYNIHSEASTIRNNSSISSPAYHHATSSTFIENSAGSTSTASRNGIDIGRNKNDPNRIKIEISGNPIVP